MKILNKVHVRGVVGDPSQIDGELTIPSNTNLKTINGVSLIGTGDITVTGGTSVVISDTPPVSPTDNTLWWSSLDGNLRIYYNDGTSSQWVDAFTGSLIEIHESNGTSFDGGYASTVFHDAEIINCGGA